MWHSGTRGIQAHRTSPPTSNKAGDIACQFLDQCPKITSTIFDQRYMLQNKFNGAQRGARTGHLVNFNTTQLYANFCSASHFFPLIFPKTFHVNLDIVHGHIFNPLPTNYQTCFFSISYLHFCVYFFMFALEFSFWMAICQC